MSDKINQVDRFFAGYNCAQTVMGIFAPELGIDSTTALKIASGFGSGMTRGETCGAVTGAYMAIGLKMGHSTTSAEAKAFTKTRIREFNERFLEIHSSLICRELIGFDLNSPEGPEAAKNAGVFANKCPMFIKTSCKILDEIFTDQTNFTSDCYD